MRHRRLGSSDLELSEISLGSWLTYGGGVGREEAEACVVKAFEVGINFLDTANVYGRGGGAGFPRPGARPPPPAPAVPAAKPLFPLNAGRGLSRRQAFQ